MLALDDIELKKTRFYQEIAEEERQEGVKEGRKEESIALITRLLHRKFSGQPGLEQSVNNLSSMSLEKMQALAEAILDFENIKDLQSWMENAQTGFK